MWKRTIYSKMASKHTENNYIAIDLVDAMLGLAKKKYRKKNIKKQKRTRKRNNYKI